MCPASAFDSQVKYTLYICWRISAGPDCLATLRTDRQFCGGSCHFGLGILPLPLRLGNQRMASVQIGYLLIVSLTIFRLSMLALGCSRRQHSLMTGNASSLTQKKDTCNDRWRSISAYHVSSSGSKIPIHVVPPAIDIAACKQARMVGSSSEGD